MGGAGLEPSPEHGPGQVRPIRKKLLRSIDPFWADW